MLIIQNAKLPDNNLFNVLQEQCCKKREHLIYKERKSDKQWVPVENVNWKINSDNKTIESHGFLYLSNMIIKYMFSI